MNRPFAIAMGAAALLIVAAVAMADDAPATSSGAPAATSAPAATKAPATTAHHSSSKSMHHHTMVNLNTASKDQLTKLPGLTEDTADKIIAARPFKSTNELVSKKILDEAEYKKLQGKVTAKHS